MRVSLPLPAGPLQSIPPGKPMVAGSTEQQSSMSFTEVVGGVVRSMLSHGHKPANDESSLITTFSDV